jgi:uncharacterized RDD family membrane protein YckC
MDDLVTGDAVVLDLRLAQLPSRAISICIDICVQVVALTVLGLAVGVASSGLDDAAQQAITLLAIVAVIVGYPVAFETLSRGRTLGKLVMGHRVVRDDGGPERFRQALVRGLFEFVEIWLTFGVLAFFASFFSRQGKRLGDTFAGTVVVRERLPDQGTQTAWLRPELAGWASTADLSRVPDELALAARGMIARWPSLDAASRTAMATDLATRVGAFVSPSSPPGTRPEDYLAAVLVERRRRHEQRLTAAPQVLAPPTATPVRERSDQAPAPANAEPPAPETGTGGSGFVLPG